MSRNAPGHLIVCYDISDPHRLQRIHRCMKRWGMPLQYSLFYCVLTPSERRRMENELRERMDCAKDDIRIYGIKSLQSIEQICGRQWYDGIVVTG